jgi:hypothetical protein
VHVDFELLADHADGIADAVLAIDDEFLREHVQDVAIFRKRDGARGVHGAAHVFALDVAGALPKTMPPRLLTPRMWLPATPTTADSTGTPATLSASSRARRMELTAASRLTMRPLREPLVSAAPMARNLAPPSSMSAISAQVFVLANVQRHQITVLLSQVATPANFF